MATAAAAARSVFRSSSARKAAARVASEAKASRSSSPFGFATRKPLSHRIFRIWPILNAFFEMNSPVVDALHELQKKPSDIWDYQTYIN